MAISHQQQVEQLRKLYAALDYWAGWMAVFAEEEETVEDERDVTEQAWDDVRQLVSGMEDVCKHS